MERIHPLPPPSKGWAAHRVISPAADHMLRKRSDAALTPPSIPSHRAQILTSHLCSVLNPAPSQGSEVGSFAVGCENNAERGRGRCLRRRYPAPHARDLRGRRFSSAITSNASVIFVNEVFVRIASVLLFRAIRAASSLALG